MSKIQADHLTRQALIYVRQSTLTQVRENVGSKERQYGLVQRALDLGWGKEQIVYEADLAHRRYTAVDPENRLVARSLERDWNEKLVAVERLERAYAAAPHPSQLVSSPEERARILSLAQDFPALWQASTTSNAERKQLLRFLVKDVTLTRRENDIHLGVRWQTGAASARTIPRRKRIDEIWRTSAEVIARIRALATHQTDRHIATQLNTEGLTTGVGQEFDRVRVRRVRLKYEIPTRCPEMPNPRAHGPRGDGRYSARVGVTYSKHYKKAPGTFFTSSDMVVLTKTQKKAS